MPKLPQKAWSLPMDCGRFQSSRIPVVPDHDRTGQERSQMRLDAHRTRARPSAAVRGREGLVQIEMADVEAEISGSREAEDRVEVGPVHVDLHALGVAHLRDLVDARLEQAERVGLRDHERGHVLVEARARSARSTSPLGSDFNWTTE
jgi:hypothetical protein